MALVGAFGQLREAVCDPPMQAEQLGARELKQFLQCKYSHFYLLRFRPRTSRPSGEGLGAEGGGPHLRPKRRGGVLSQKHLRLLRRREAFNGRKKAVTVSRKFRKEMRVLLTGGTDESFHAGASLRDRALSCSRSRVENSPLRQPRLGRG